MNPEPFPSISRSAENARRIERNDANGRIEAEVLEDWKQWLIVNGLWPSSNWELSEQDFDSGHLYAQALVIKGDLCPTKTN